MPQLRGSQHPRAKLTEQQAEYIRTVYSPGIVTMRELAEETGVHVSTVCAVLQGRTWNGEGSGGQSGLAPSLAEQRKAA